jgi:superfamily II RNA helicase
MTTPLLCVPDAMTAPANWPPPEPLAIPTNYELDPFQKHAVLGIHAGDHVFVTAKTGSGKTAVGEYLCARALAAGKRVFYTTPIKSLSNQKYHDLKRLFPQATVGILTGDIKMCPDAQIVVMTAEILRNLFYKRGTATEGVGLTAAVSLDGVVGIVMDEVHYIQDPDRGHVWEESLILCPRDLQLVLLSATLPSAASLAGWLADLHQRRTWLLSTTYRIVPLVHGVLEPSAAEGDHGWRPRPVLDRHDCWIGDAYTAWLQGRRSIEDAAAAHKRAVGAAKHGSGSVSGSGAYWNRADHDASRDAAATALRASKVKVESPAARLRRTVTWLYEAEKMPALFFVFSRKECERLAAQVDGALIDTSDQAAAAHIMDFHLSRHRAALEKSPQYHQIRELLLRGVAFHHSGLQPLLKEIVEVLFTRGYVKVLFATETFSVGLNMPTKTVVFLELEKWCDGGQRRPLRADEYIQMAGRAGRRGLDKQGLVLYEPLRDPLDAYQLKAMLTGGLPALSSRMRFGYEFVLRNALAADGAVDIAGSSYWAVQQRASRVAMGAELDRLDARVIAAEGGIPVGLEAALIEKAALTAAVAQNVNAKRKKAQAELARWAVDHEDDVPKGQWPVVEKAWASLQEIRRERDALRQQIANWDAAPLLSLETQESALARWGFMTESPLAGRDGSRLSLLGRTATDTPLAGRDSHCLTLLGKTATDTPLADRDGSRLTLLGRTATEINEGHPILMALFATSGLLTPPTATAADIAIVLAAFSREAAGPEEEQPSLADLEVSPAARAALEWLGATADRLSREDTTAVADYWSLNTMWPAIVARWLDGAPVATLAAEFGLFEGNIQRGLLKIANLLDEWSAVATIRTDLPTLEAMSAFQLLAGRDDIVVDSIYLRL